MVLTNTALKNRILQLEINKKYEFVEEITSYRSVQEEKFYSQNLELCQMGKCGRGNRSEPVDVETQMTQRRQLGQRQRCQVADFVQIQSSAKNQKN